MKVKLILVLLVISLAFLASFAISNLDRPKASPLAISSQVAKTQIQGTSEAVLKMGQTFKVARVIDGDTIELEGGQKVRYIGIDAPETVHPNKTIECFGQEASAKNSELVLGKSVFLEKDISQVDKYGRLLRYVYVDGIFVNVYLIRQGYANSSTYPPDIKYQSLFMEAQKEAQSKSLGLWGQCRTDDQKSTLPQPVSGGTCNIKGNISSSGEKIYHMIDQYYYNKTVIDESRGERWFCSEQEAISAGWRKSKK